MNGFGEIILHWVSVLHSEIDFGRQGRRERVHGLDVVAESRECLTIVAP